MMHIAKKSGMRIEYAYGEGDDLFLAYNHRIVRTDLPEANYQDGVDVLKSYNVSERFARTLQELSLWTNDNMFDNTLRFIESDQGLIVLHDELDSDLTHTRFWITDGIEIEPIGDAKFTGLFQNAVDRIVVIERVGGLVGVGWGCVDVIGWAGWVGTRGGAFVGNRGRSWWFGAVWNRGWSVRW